MGLWNLLEKGYEKLQEYTPQLMELSHEIMEYKSEYAELTNDELVKLTKDNELSRRKAAFSLLHDRGYERVSTDDGYKWRRRQS